MATDKKKKTVKVGDLKPAKDAKGGARHADIGQRRQADAGQRGRQADSRSMAGRTLA